MTAIALAIAMTLTTPTPTADTFAAGSCTSYSWKVPPSHIRVLRAHHKGSSVPKHVDVFTTDRYVAAVMASGAWPNRVWESAKVGAIAIRGWALWMVMNHQRGYSWHGQCYSVTDGDQYIRADIHPWSKLPTRTLTVVHIMRSITLKKNGHHFRTGWSGGAGIDGWHANEDTVRGLALLGWGWRRIVHHIYSPNERIIGDWK